MMRALLKSMRLRQWPKNLFLMAAVVFDGKLTNLHAVLNSLAGVGLFCLISSSVYLINDIRDVEADRQHPVKNLRPIASGKLSVRAATIAAVLLLAFSFPMSYLLSLVLH